MLEIVSNLHDFNSVILRSNAGPGLGIGIVGVYGLRRRRALDQSRLRQSRFQRVNVMTDHVVPHFQNDAGVSVIEIGATEFMCVGARPPFDHPHVFLDMGGDGEIICPYCSTLYRHAPDLAAGQSRPPECALKEEAA